MLKRRFSPSTAIACVALFLSLSGIGYAAARGYLITSVHQIKPSVRHALRGERGRRGPAGALPTPSPLPVTVSQALTPTSPTASITAVCPPPEVLVSGGFTGVGEIVTQSHETTLGAHWDWSVVAHLDPNYTGTAATVSVEAMCARSN